MSILSARSLFRTTASALVLAMTAPFALAQQSGSLTDTLVATYNSSAQIQAQRSSLKALNERYPQALANFRPTITASGSAGVAEDEFDSTAGTQSSSRSPRVLALEAQQPIFRGGRSIAERNAAMADIMAGRAQLTNTEQEVLLNAITAHMAVLQASAVVALNQKNEDVLRRNLEATRDRFRVGEVTLTDTAQAESRLARATADLIRAKGDLIAARANYKRVVGNEAPMAIARPDVMPAMPGSLDEALKVAQTESPIVQAAHYQRESADYSVRERKGALLPEIRVDGSASNSEDASSFNAGTVTSTQATARLTIPLYQAGAEHSRVRQAQETAAQRRSELLDQSRLVTENVISAWSNLDTARARITSLNAVIKAAEIALDGVRQEAMAGTRTVLEVLDAEQELLDGRVNMVAAEREQVVAQYSVLAAVGRLTPKQLRLPVASYDPATDFDAVKGKWIGFSRSAE